MIHSRRRISGRKWGIAMRNSMIDHKVRFPSTRSGGWLRTRAGFLAAPILISVLIFGITLLPGIAGKALAASPMGDVPDFSVDTALGKHVFSQQRGKALVYFFSFPG
jgi:hypothetical protein